MMTFKEFLESDWSGDVTNDPEHIMSTLPPPVNGMHDPGATHKWNPPTPGSRSTPPQYAAIDPKTVMAKIQGIEASQAEIGKKVNGLEAYVRKMAARNPYVAQPQQPQAKPGVTLRSVPPASTPAA